VCALTVIAGIAGIAPAQRIIEGGPEAIRNLEVTERLGEPLPRGLTFTDHNGETVALDDVIARGRPIVFAFIYFDCPVVCPMVLDRVQQGVRGLEDYHVGEDFTLLVISFDHTEGPAETASRRILDVAGYGRTEVEGVREGFVYLTGTAGNIRAVSEATGFPFRRLSNGEYSHPVGVMVLSPEGRMMRYLYGFEYDPFDLKMSLLDATDGKAAKSLGDTFLGFCYRYDPEAGAYSVEAMAVMRLAGVLTVIGLVVFIGAMFLGERMKAERAACSARRDRRHPADDAHEPTRIPRTGELVR